jgi:hypothetical protein
MNGETQSKRNGFTMFLGVACAALAVLTLLLTRQNLTLKSRLAAASAAASAPPPGALKAGDTVAPFDVVDVSGNRSHVAFDGGETLLLVFSSTCGACRETVPMWNRLLAQPVAPTVHVVGLQTDFKASAPAEGGAPALPIPDLRFPVFGAAEHDSPIMTKIPAIPAAAIVGPGGVVKAVWFGVPTDSQVSELRRDLAG